MTLPHGQLSVRRGQQCAEGELVAFPPGLRPRLDDAGACDTVEMGRRCVVSNSEQVNAMIEAFLDVSRSAAA